MKNYKTEQEIFWAGKFGDEYITRNSSMEMISRKIFMWRKMLANIKNLTSCIEFGPNIGGNLIALERLFPQIKQKAIEINASACKKLQENKQIEVIEQSILDYSPAETFDLSFTCGVLIHINPNELHKVYKNLFNSSHKYILIQEYYSLEPMEKNYRGHSGRLFKRDFAQDILNLYPTLSLIDYGFFYHNDPMFQEDSNWFLFKKLKY